MRMSPSEAVMWTVEKDPSLRSDFCNITILDRVPSEHRLRATVERALISIPRLGERVVSPPLRIAAPEWRPDPTFDVEYHVRRVAIPHPGSMPRAARRRRDCDLAAARPLPPALGVHARRGARGRAGGPAPAPPSHDHRRRGRDAPLAQPRRRRTGAEARRHLRRPCPGGGLRDAAPRRDVRGPDRPRVAPGRRPRGDPRPRGHDRRSGPACIGAAVSTLFSPTRLVAHAANRSSSRVRCGGRCC